MRVTRRIVVSLLTFIVASQAFAQSGTWEMKASLPQPRAQHGVAASNGILYAVGGQIGDAATDTVVAYDPTSNTWTSRTSTSQIRKNHALGVINGIVYAVGGDDNNVILSSVEAYNPATNSWSSRDSLLTARSGLAVGVVNGIMYAVGGFSPGVTETVEAYDPATDSWTMKAPMLQPRYLPATAAVNGLLYVMGGFDNSSGSDIELATVEVYNPATDIWTSRAPMPTARHGLAAVAIDGIIYAIGGFNGSSLTTVEAYNPSTNTWTAAPSLPEARSLVGAADLSNIIYAVGGRDSSFAITDRVEALAPSQDTTITVTIDIKPGSFPNSINLGSNGTVPVAIFSTATFDAMAVDPLTVTLAGAQVKLKGKGTPQASFEDINGDGLLDLVVHVSTEALQLSEGDTEAVLEGRTFGGTLIRGVDSVRIVP
jgi:N-acetylneuraminic acid mutarotase